MSRLKYLPEERKVLINEGIKMSEKVQQQLNYIANVIYDSISTWKPSSFHIIQDGSNINIQYQHHYDDRLVFHIKKFDVDNTKIEMEFNFHYDDVSILKKVAQKYFIDKIYVYNIISRRCNMEELPSNTFDVFYTQLPQLGELTVCSLVSSNTPEECNLLSRWISNDKFPKMMKLDWRLQYASIYLERFSDIYNADLQERISNAFRKLFSTCESEQDNLLAIKIKQHKFRTMPGNEFPEFTDLCRYNTSRKDLVVKSLANMVKEYHRVGKEEYLRSKAFDQAFEQITENNTLKLIWNLKDDHKMHTEISKELLLSGDDNAAYTQEEVKTDLEVLTRGKTIIDDVRNIDIENIKAFEGLSPQIKSVVLSKAKLPPELQEQIIPEIPIAFRTEELQRIDTLKKVFELPELKNLIERLNNTAELEQINTLKQEIFVLLDKIDIAATADGIQLDKFLESRTIEDNIKPLGFETEIVAISDDVPACNTVDSSNNIDLPLDGNCQNMWDGGYS